MSKEAAAKDNAVQKKLSKVMQRTEQLLTEEPETRKSDKFLIVRYLERFHGINDVHEILRLDVPSFETIRRSRQRIQADGRCLPEKDVAEQRAENQLGFFKFFRRRRHNKTV